MNRLLLNFSILFCFSVTNLNAQQRYSGDSAKDCDGLYKTDLSPAFLYIYNGQSPSCRAFLIFKSQPPYNSVHTISDLMSSDPLELAHINNVSASTTFPTNKEVIVPINCSCSGQFYQANSSYIIQNDSDTYFTIAKDTYQGLSTCSSLVDENSFSASKLKSGLNLTVPLRCACPTSNQTEEGIKYLLTYPVYWEDSVPDVSKRFNVSQNRTLDANGFSKQDPVLVPFTTILIPLPIEPLSSQTIIHLPPHVPTFVNKRPKKQPRVVIGLAAGGSLLVIFVVLIIAYFYKKLDRSKHQKDHRKGKKQYVLPEVLLAGLSDVDRTLKFFTFEELQAATNNFSSECRIMGSIYRGVVDGRALAIKKMSTDVSKEANLLHKINHFNLIRLHGICVGGENCYLVNEYMENGCLKDWLCTKNRSSVLSWTQRVQIALDVANGLHYLHNFTEPAYVHKDIKTSNILLNGDLRAKIANFALATSSEGKEGLFAMTRHVVGTVGYMAPEYFATGLVTPKLDVYAFGVVMLELITGKTAIIEHDGGEMLLSMAIISIVEGGDVNVKLCEFMDSNLCGSYRTDLALGVTKLSAACLRQDPTSRPSMDDVVSILSIIQSNSQHWESSNVELAFK
ncbi:protein LYK5-like [Magnolia sinica]|uniref:protein LYK5-like n=1 Tax=Magnolia sinica TaxID=86752 RepID=UPI00265B65E8|nr:protein LYK5-like [Magnolia sinica]